MKAWREQDKAGHEQRRTEMSERRKQFSEKYPEAATEMKSWRDGPGPRAGFRRHPVQPGFRDGGRD